MGFEQSIHICLKIDLDESVTISKLNKTHQFLRWHMDDFFGIKIFNIMFLHYFIKQYTFVLTTHLCEWHGALWFFNASFKMSATNWPSQIILILCQNTLHTFGSNSIIKYKWLSPDLCIYVISAIQIPLGSSVL